MALRGLTDQISYMQTSIPRRPLYDAPFSEVVARVCYQLVVLDYRRNPNAYSPYAPSGILALGDSYKLAGLGYLRFALMSMAKHVMAGGSTQEWRELYPDYRGFRAAHKVRLTRGPRR